MPILAREPCLYPDDLLDADELPRGDRRWWVLHVKPRQEKSLGRDVLAQAIPFYLPLAKQRWRQRGRKMTSYVPLFPGYVFLWGSEEERIRGLQTNRVVRVLTVDDGQGLLHDLLQIQQLIASGAPLTIEERLAPGHRVRVREGSFKGLEGTVLRRRGQTRLVIAVNFLQQGASVEIDDFLLEATEWPQ